MHKQLRHISIATLAMFLALFVSLSVIQVFAVDELRADGRNVRTLFASYSAERGPILVAGEECRVWVMGGRHGGEFGPIGEENMRRGSNLEKVESLLSIQNQGGCIDADGDVVGNVV